MSVMDPRVSSIVKELRRLGAAELEAVAKELRQIRGLPDGLAMKIVGDVTVQQQNEPIHAFGPLRYQVADVSRHTSMEMLADLEGEHVSVRIDIGHDERMLTITRA